MDLDRDGFWNRFFSNKKGDRSEEVHDTHLFHVPFVPDTKKFNHELRSGI